LDRFANFLLGFAPNYRSLMWRAGRPQLLALAWLAAVATACSNGAAATGRPATATAAQEALALHGGVLRPPDIEPALTLTDTAGTAYNVTRRNPGKVTLVFFGYTHCPDVCPTTMADIAQALRRTSPAVRSQVTVVFITVDPTRDSRPVLRRWLDGFDPAFVGLRGPLRKVIAAQRAAHLPVSKVAKNGKTVEHAAAVLAYTPDHRAHVLYFDGPSTIDDLSHDLPILVTGQGFGA
jgi:protein SCO1/2